MQLRPYQNDLVEQVRNAWKEGYKAPCIVLGCGGGKSCIVAEIARRTTWIRHSEKTAEAFMQSGISAAHIDGSTPKIERDKIIADFRNGRITILCNVDLISEGFDVPDCECAIFLRPTHSLTLYIQQSMRCMRYKPNKRAVIIDHVGNYARHGMPDDDREWTLEKKKRNKIQQEKEQATKVLQCPECFFTFSPEVFDGNRKVCPHCGYMFPNKERKIEIEEETKLIKVVGFKLDYSGPEQCQSYAELVEYAKQHGYKRGWAYYQAKKRGMIA